MDRSPRAAIERTATSPDRAPMAALLKAELARLQVRLIDAQAYVQRGLAQAPLSNTSPELEEGVLSLLRDAARGITPEDRAIAALIDAAAGPRELSQLVSIFEAQVASLAPEAPDPAAFSARATSILDRLAARALRTFSGAAAPDHRAAFASMLAASDVLSCGFSAAAIYPANRDHYGAANSFTNESGFPKLTARIDAKGGAAVGVGGVMFDLGSLGSELIVCVDANPKIRDIIHTFTAILLAVDARATANGWDDDRRAREVLLRLSRGKSDETRAELEALGLPARVRDSLDDQLEAFKAKLDGTSVEFAPVPHDLWCRGDRAAPRIAHLTRLALEGRIVALTADLADPHAVDRINALLAAHQTRAKIVHFSNTLDYVADIRGTVRAFGALDMRDDAMWTTCANLLRDAGARGGPAAQQLAGELGTLHDPAINRAKDWLGAGKKGERLHALAWNDQRQRQILAGYLFGAHGVRDTGEVPATFEAHQALTRSIVARTRPQ